MKKINAKLKILLGFIMVLLGVIFSSVMLIEDLMIWILALIVLCTGLYIMFNRIRFRYDEGSNVAKVYRYLFLGALFVSSIIIRVFIK